MVKAMAPLIKKYPNDAYLKNISENDLDKIRKDYKESKVKKEAELTTSLTLTRVDENVEIRKDTV